MSVVSRAWSKRPWAPAAGRALLERLAGGRPIEGAVCTATRADVGQWLFDARVWLGVCGGELLVAAAGKVPVAFRVPLDALRRSLYNPFTGQLVLDPAPGAALRHLSLPPVEGEALATRLRGGRPGGEKMPAGGPDGATV